ncbi:DUF3179 domain-containing protein [Halogeometricum limi]|uniref:DUF3179 domain-containing protein n=1 Tax=Halogeometricum limi TaxID=555875 RepID=A0A1I6IQ56_9EURY|nr:DUF3179 domain-containing protein [Halogeometricum limi]SFR68872.1 Protein of unknown function [Halogeometricum limi]
MNRRQFLSAAGVGATGCLCGCVGGEGSAPSGGGDTNASNAPREGFDATDAAGDPDPVGFANVSLPVPMDELNRGAPLDAIPAIVTPEFDDDWADVDATLDDGELVVGVELAGEARAYPLAVLNWHEIVNDEFDRPVLVTFCPLCGSAVVAERVVGGDTRTFGVSGYLWQSDLVMYDSESDSLWSQILATAIRGPLTGTQLDLLPSTTTSWGEWRDSRPETTVLLPPPLSDTVTGRVTRDYDRDPYLGYDTSSRVGIGYNDEVDDRLHPKTRVVGVAHGNAAVAYPLPVVSEASVVNDDVDGLPVVVAASTQGTLVAYVRRVDGETLTFEREPGADVLTAGGSRWDLHTGRAVDGAREGATLARANDRSPMFWFAWADFFPETEIHGE